MFGLAAIVAFMATIPAANWMIGHVGDCIPSGPCVIPVGFGYMAPSGVLMIGLALVLRDWVHELAGWRWAVAAIVGGSIMSLFIAPPALAMASGLAFMLAEASDFAVYAPLRRRQLGMAVLLSGIVGAVIDSAVFLWLAFGSLDFLAGQVIGKAWMSAIAFVVISFARPAKVST